MEISLPSPVDLYAAFQNTYTDLESAIDAEHRADRAAIRARAKLQAARAEIILRHMENPRELGSNESAREAALSVRCAPELATVTNADADHEDAKLQREKIRLRVDYYKSVLRLLELSRPPQSS